MRATFDIHRTRRTVGEARAALRPCLHDLPRPLADAVLLVASELVTNVMRHTRQGTGIVDLVVRGRGVRLAVSDDDPRPVVEPTDRPAPNATGGRGLVIVYELAAAVRQVARRDGKTIIVTFRVPSPPRSPPGSVVDPH